MTSRGADDSALLATRAAQLARPLDEGQNVQRLDLLLVDIGGRQVALPLRDVREVRPPGRLAQAPVRTGALTGVVGGQGAVLPVASLATLLEMPTAVLPDDQWVVAVEDGPTPLGLLVDMAVDIVTVDHSALSASSGHGLISALLPDGVAVLDIQTLRRDPRLSLSPADPTQEPRWDAR